MTQLEIEQAIAAAELNELNDLMVELALGDDTFCRNCPLTMTCGTAECVNFRKRQVKLTAERRLIEKYKQKKDEKI